jgi:hypothetical protein
MMMEMDDAGAEILVFLSLRFLGSDQKSKNHPSTSATHPSKNQVQIVRLADQP